MPDYCHIPANVLREQLARVLGITSEHLIRLDWEDPGRYELYEDRYALTLLGVEFRANSVSGVAYRMKINIEELDQVIIKPLQSLLQLPFGQTIESIHTRAGEIDERGFPTGKELLVCFD